MMQGRANFTSLTLSQNFIIIQNRSNPFPITNLRFSRVLYFQEERLGNEYTGKSI
jgi:hypothetical protein